MKIRGVVVVAGREGLAPVESQPPDPRVRSPPRHWPANPLSHYAPATSSCMPVCGHHLHTQTQATRAAAAALLLRCCCAGTACPHCHGMSSLMSLPLRPVRQDRCVIQAWLPHQANHVCWNIHVRLGAASLGRSGSVTPYQSPNPSSVVVVVVVVYSPTNIVSQ